MIRRLGTASVLLVAFATVAAQAQAATAPTATTGSASHVTALSASLNGSTFTSGLATGWQFQYGTSTSYDKTTPAHAIAAGKGVVAVTAPVVALKPGTVYHFRLVVVATVPASYYYYFPPSAGGDKTFKTPKIGTLKIGPGTLKIKHSATTASLRCSSTVACKGTLALTLNTKVSHHRTKTYICASSKFSLAAGKTNSLKLKIKGLCVSLLANAPHKRLKVSLSARLTSGQRNTSRSVTFKLV